MMRNLLQRWSAVFGFGLLLMLVGGTWLWAQGEQSQLKVKADRVESKKESSTVRLTKYYKAIVTQDDVTFTADLIAQRSQKDEHVFTCTGSPVTFVDSKNGMTITSQSLVAYSTPRRAEFTDPDHVTIHIKKQPQQGSDVKSQMASEETVITCKKFSYDYASKQALATGDVLVEQKARGRKMWADEARYENVNDLQAENAGEMIYLTGNVRMESTSDELQNMKNAETVTISLTNDWIDSVAKDGEKVEMLFNVPEDTTAKKPK